MSELTLKQGLDGVDERVKKDVKNGFKDSRKRIEIGMWEKGKIIWDFRGVNSQSFYQMEKTTKRDHKSLKNWYDLYISYPERELYLPIAEEKAEEWTKKVFISSLGIDGHTSKSIAQDNTLEHLVLKCLVEHHSGCDPMWIENCHPCLRTGLCHQITEIVEKSPILRKEKRK